MKQKNLIRLYVIFSILVLGIVLALPFFKKEKEEISFCRIDLKGDKIINLKANVKYEELGFSAFDNMDGDITSEVVVTNKIDYSESGTYEVTYEVENSQNLSCQTTRYVVLEYSGIPNYLESYDTIDNTPHSWWSNNKKNYKRPTGAFDSSELEQYGAYFLGPDEKKIYLTFDEGTNDTYVKEILGVLNDNDVKATFFFCKNYILKNPDLMKDLVKSGQSVGNHTANHVEMSTYANKEGYDRFVREIMAVEEAFFETTGSKLDKVYREPKGEWSLRSLKMVQDLGYTSYFWSADYLDWDKEVTGDYAYNELIKRYHNGAIYLIHPKNKGNYLGLDRLIKELKSLGYEFDLVKNIP